nr:acetate--CoA ligase family protein [Longispora sp. (in: high G+C Gram-positive bacteria)]
TLATLDSIVPTYGSTLNPIDVTAAVTRNPSLVTRCLTAVDRDAGVDAIVLCFCVLTGEDVTGIIEALTDIRKPVVVSRTGAEHLAPTATEALRDLDVPSFPTPARAVRALAAMWGKPADCDGGKAGDGSERSLGPPELQPPVDEAALKRALSAGGITVPHGYFLSGADDFDFPDRAVLKAVVPGLVHKTEAGGVILDVTAGTVTEAFARLEALGGRVWAEEQVNDGVEVLVSVSPSPLGRILTIGAGGVWAEVLDDVAIRVLPAADIPAMLDELRIAPVLRGYRGRPAADVDALLDLVTKLIDVTSGWPSDVSVELNPVSVRPCGAVVLDAVCVRSSESVTAVEV